jgi:putative endonuclease
MKRRYYVYIMTNRWRTLYVGVTSDIVRRVRQYRTGSRAGFTQRYLIDRLVHVEACASPIEAIAREKQIKGWTRVKKTALIESSNPGWADLAADWFDDASAVPYRDAKDSSLRSE